MNVAIVERSQNVGFAIPIGQLKMVRSSRGLWRGVNGAGVEEGMAVGGGVSEPLMLICVATDFQGVIHSPAHEQDPSQTDPGHGLLQHVWYVMLSIDVVKLHMTTVLRWLRPPQHRTHSLVGQHFAEELTSPQRQCTSFWAYQSHRHLQRPTQRATFTELIASRECL